MSVKVDPDALRAWAQWLDGLSDSIEQMAADVTVGFGASIPGTDLPSTLNDTRERIKNTLSSFASRPAEMAEIARGNGDNYEITDDSFAAKLQGMGGLS
ncbi:hypothetical protein GV791_04835 [Nocardia cyriacigeorgica]|uniref:ESX-1 secretion-associated protein n=2 Tax=Nocardia cyriacigeorgica TaxID=135487 RepID=H6R2Q3_NOCCG|nr:hypothetical protein [Nocardia cyriacigeorgica]MBF6286972.1 hypothetical protein [Nocardia cyriacigeorgica]MBF6425474.1 hypothetical protein [Nocardia cyriacigeorgica]NEW31888.1 hypothetical protein [Nocardia cyriacigeorgica]CCF61903.1 protein of unknown function [Nocardia cyriacigeorgica GUH-2]